MKNTREYARNIISRKAVYLAQNVRTPGCTNTDRNIQAVLSFLLVVGTDAIFEPPRRTIVGTYRVDARLIRISIRAPVYVCVSMCV